MIEFARQRTDNAGCHYTLMRGSAARTRAYWQRPLLVLAAKAAAYACQRAYAVRCWRAAR